MSLVTRLLPDNPVLTKELRVRMRGARAYWILFGYLGFLSLVMLLSYYSWQQTVLKSGGSSEASHFGAQIFMYIVITQVFLVLFITPAITSGSLTIEREQRTMDMLTMTRLPRRSIIIGKLLSAVAFTALLLVSSLPLISICFMLGSVDPAMVISNYLMLLLGSFLIGALGLMWSSIAKTTTQAVMYTYATLFFLFFFGTASMSAREFGMRGGDLIGNLFGVVGVSWFGNSFLGLHGPEGIGFAVICAIGGVLLSAIAMTRIEMWPERQGRLLRLLTLLLVGIQLLAANLIWLNGWYRRGGAGVQAIVNPPIAVLILAFILLLIAVPVFATGEMLPSEGRDFWKYLRRGWSFKGLSRGKMHSGLPFLLLLTTLCLGLYALAFVLTGHTADITRSAPPVGAPAFAKAAGDFWQAALVIYASVIGFSLFCQFLSVAFRNRWIAWVIASIFLMLVFVSPEIARNSSDSYGDSKIGPSINLYYFNPVQALVQMNDVTGYWNHRPLWMGNLPMWQAVTYVWLFIGLLSLWLTRPFVSKMRKNTTEIPYEEMVANV